MLWIVLSFVGALVATYWISRLLLVLAPGTSDGTVVLAHVGSFVLLAFATGLGKAYFSPFNFGATLVYIVPQLIWLAYDWVRRP